MSKGATDSKWFFGFVVGTGVGLAAAALLDPRIRARLAALVREGTLELADRLVALGLGADDAPQRNQDRAGRILNRKMDKLRAAGL